MSKRQPKGEFQFNVQVRTRDGRRVAKLEINSGGLHYFRKHADSGAPTHSLTLQQLTDLLQQDAAIKAIDPHKSKLPRPHSDGDLLVEVGDPPQQAGRIVKPLDPSGFFQGRYSFTDGMARDRTRQDADWVVTLSAQAAIQVVDLHITELMSKNRQGHTTNKDVVISKDDTRHILQSWLSRLGTPAA